ncbi:MAG TPA: FeoB-associated Cys-rich membrane protein [Abditibacterium sp.]
MTQDFAVYLIVAGAAAYLVRHWVLTTKGDKSCGGCGGCSSAPKKAEPKLVQIDLGGSWKK